MENPRYEWVQCLQPTHTKKCNVEEICAAIVYLKCSCTPQINGGKSYFEQYDSLRLNCEMPHTLT